MHLIDRMKKTVLVALVAAAAFPCLISTAIADHFPNPPMPTAESVALYGAPTVNGSPLMAGDELAAFSVHPKPGSPGKWERSLAGHAVVTTPGQFGFMSVYADDPLTPAVVEGFKTGEEMLLVVWRASEGREYVACTTPPPEVQPTGWRWTFNNDQIQILGDWVDGQRIPLRTGFWNLVSHSLLSGYYKGPSFPAGAQLEGISWTQVATAGGLGDAFPLKSIEGKFDRVLGNDGNGTKTWDPARIAFSSLSSLAPGYGYWIKMKPSIDNQPLAWMTVPGARATGSETLALNSGWTLAGYWGPDVFNDSATAAPMTGLFPVDTYSSDNVLLSSMGDLWGTLGSDLSRVISFDGGGSKIWSYALPGFSTLHAIGPGYGTWVRMSAPGTLSFPPTITDPAVPKGVTATGGNGQATISWRPVPEAAYYFVYMSTSPTVSPEDFTDWYYADASQSPSCLIEGLSNGETYHFVVTATNTEYTESRSSIVVSATPRVPPPSAPALPSAQSGDGTVTLRWGAVGGATSYTIYWSASSNVSKSNGTRIADATSPRTISGLANATTYYFVVTASGPGGESAESPVVSAVPVSSILPPPSSVSAVGGNGSIMISWPAVPGAAGYNLYWSTSPGVTKANGNLLGGVIGPYVHYPLTNGTPRYYIVTTIGSGGEGVASAVATATPTAGTTGLVDAKAMVQDLRDTANSLVNYQQALPSSRTGVFDNAVNNMKAEIDNVIAPYFKKLAPDAASFLFLSYQAMWSYPSGGNFVSDKSDGLAYGSARSDGKWKIHTASGLNITLTPAAAGSQLIAVDFSVGSDIDNVLSYTGTISGAVVDPTWHIITSSRLNASFRDATTGPAWPLTMNGSASLALDGSGNITGLTLSGSFGSRYLSGSAIVRAQGLFLRPEYLDLRVGQNETWASQPSRFSLDNVVLNTAKGTFRGSVSATLRPSKLAQENFRVANLLNPNDNGVMQLLWDERSGTPALVDIPNGVWGWGRRYLSDNVTRNGNAWVLVKHTGWTWSGMSDNTTYRIVVNRTTNPAAPTITGSVTGNLAWTGDSTVNFAGTYLGRNATNFYPDNVTFTGRYTNIDNTVALDYVEGTIAGTLLNPTTFDPFISGVYDKFTTASFPQVRATFSGKVALRNRPLITVSIDGSSSMINSGGPTPGRRYAVVSATTTYTDWIETISGPGSAWFQESVNPVDGESVFDFEKFLLTLTNAKGIHLDLVGQKGNAGLDPFRLSGSLYSGATTFGTLEYINALPVIRWSDGYFVSVP